MTSEDPIAIPGETSEPTTRVGPGAVLGIAIGFFVVLGCLGLIAFHGWRTFVASEGLETSFELSGLPEGFTLSDDAYLLPSGERVYVIADGSKELTRLPVEDLGGLEPGEGESTEADTGDDHDFEEYDWTSIPVESTDQAPMQFFLVQYPTKRAEAVIRSEFQGLDWKELKYIGAKGGRSAVEGGKLEWAGYAADFVREREFIRGGTFRDVLRVNLSVGGECWVGYALWPTSHAGSEKAAEEFLAGIRPIKSAG